MCMKPLVQGRTESGEATLQRPQGVPALPAKLCSPMIGAQPGLAQKGRAHWWGEGEQRCSQAVHVLEASEMLINACPCRSADEEGLTLSAHACHWPLLTACTTRSPLAPA